MEQGSQGGRERDRDTAESKGDGEGVKGRHKMINHLAGALGLETHKHTHTHTSRQKETVLERVLL